MNQPRWQARAKAGLGVCVLTCSNRNPSLRTVLKPKGFQANKASACAKLSTCVLAANAERIHAHQYKHMSLSAVFIPKTSSPSPLAAGTERAKHAFMSRHRTRMTMRPCRLYSVNVNACSHHALEASKISLKGLDVLLHPPARLGRFGGSLGGFATSRGRVRVSRLLVLVLL